MRRNNLISHITVWLLITVILSGCNRKPADGITVDIGLIYPDATPSVEAPIDQVRADLAEWESLHPDVNVDQRIRLCNDDFSYLAVIGTEHMPDVFITDCLTGRLLAQAGLVMDLTDYAEDVDVFTFDNCVYAFPVLRESVSVIVYDPENWSRGDSVGYSSEGGLSVADNYLSSVLSDDEGQEWFDHMTHYDLEASFTDDLFVERYATIFEQIGNDTAYGSTDSLIDAFVSGSCPAAIVCGDDVYRLLDCAREQNPELYNRIEFTTYEEGYLPCEYRYGVYVNSGLTDERRDLCIDLAQTLAGAYEDEYDDTTMRLEELINDSDHVHVVTCYFNPHFWSFSITDCFARSAESNMTAEEYAFVLQNYYEQYYLNVW